jgi:hypothetical protein
LQIELDNKSGSFRNNKNLLSNLQGNSVIISPQLIDYLKDFSFPIVFPHEEIIQKTLQSNLYADFSVKVYNFADSYISKIAGVELLSALKTPGHLLFLNSDDKKPISESLLYSLDISSPDVLKALIKISYKLNAVLKAFFERRSVNLISVTSYFVLIDDKYFIKGDFKVNDLVLSPKEIDKKINRFIEKPNEALLKHYINFVNKILV